MTSPAPHPERQDFLGPYKRPARRLYDVLALDYVTVSVDASQNRRLELDVGWGPVLGGAGLDVDPGILNRALSIAMSPEDETTLVLLRPWTDDASLDAPYTRAWKLAADIWQTCVEAAADSAGVQAAVGAFSEVLREPLTPDASVVTLQTPRGRRLGGTSPHFETLLKYGLRPQSKSASPAPILVHQQPRSPLFNVPADPAPVFRAPLTEHLEKLISVLELVLLEAVVTEIRRFAEQSRAEEEMRLHRGRAS